MFYKYRPWNEFTRTLLQSNSFYYTDPKTFNDIHECVVRPQDGTQIHGHTNLTLDAKTNYRIYCLSKSKNHPLMWAHYADSYKGICLEFEFHHEDRHCNQPREIIYQDTPPIITDEELRNGADVSNKVFGYKHS